MNFALGISVRNDTNRKLYIIISPATVKSSIFVVLANVLLEGRSKNKTSIALFKIKYRLCSPVTRIEIFSPRFLLQFRLTLNI